MAASDPKPSPTSLPVQQPSTVTASQSATNDNSSTQYEKEMKPIEDFLPATPSGEKPKPVESTLTYESSESSEYYVKAKQFLAEGDFEQALATCEEGLMTTRTLLESTLGSFTHDPSFFDFHESMAPFHYLYGTTLLYSIEESSDNQVVTVNQDSNAADEPEEPSVGDALVADAGVAEETAAVAAAVAADDGDHVPEDTADDMQIAWENLDAARKCVETMLANTESDRTSKLKLDLSQILLREGDLQRLNGLYAEAVQDYSACLELRKHVLSDKYDRKIADVEYNLGLCYLSSSSELQKEPTPDEASKMDMAARQKLSQEHCQKGIQHYIECSKVLSGKIAVLCGKDPQPIVSGAGADEKTMAGFKTTGLDDDAPPSESTTLLSGIRKRVASLQPMEADNAVVVSALKELLDDIQETVDEAESSHEAVRQASELKVQAQMAVAQEDGKEVTDASGVTTSIGFGQPVLPAEAAEIKSEAKPIMIIKKKKKHEPEGEGQNKRAKTE